MEDMDLTGGAKEPSRCGRRHTRFPWQLRAAVFLAGTWLLMQAVRVVSYGMLVIADGIRVALGCGSVLS